MDNSPSYARRMREAYHDQLDSIFDDLAGICRRVETAVGLATEALMTGDAAIAERVISDDAEIDIARERVEGSRSTCCPCSSRLPPTCAPSWLRCGW